MEAPIRTRIKHFLGESPRRFYWASKWTLGQTPSELLCSRDTDIVIEGFPRSANTFAVVAFQQAQRCRESVNIAHHHHVEAQLIKAAQLDKPACALIRHPEAAVKSLVVRHPELSAGWALKRYVTFYSRLLPMKKSIFFAEFQTVISDFGSVIDGLNVKFGTEFSTFQHTEPNVQAAFHAIEKINRLLHNGEESFVSRPSRTRRDLQAKVDVLLDPQLLADADAVYRELTRCA